MSFFLCAGIIAGVIQFVLGVIRAGSITNYIPVAVIEGMLAGIGFLIIVKQLPYAIGTDKLLFKGTDSFINIHLGTLIITLLSMSIMLGWDHSAKLKKIKLLPSALIAVIVSVLLNNLFIALDSHLAVPENQLVHLPAFSSWQDLKDFVIFPDFRGFTHPSIWVTGGGDCDCCIH